MKSVREDFSPLYNSIKHEFTGFEIEDQHSVKYYTAISNTD